MFRQSNEPQPGDRCADDCPDCPGCIGVGEPWPFCDDDEPIKLSGKWATVVANNGIGDWPLNGPSKNVESYCDLHGYTISKVLYDGDDFSRAITIFIDNRGVQFVL